MLYGTRIHSGSIWEDRACYARAVVLPTAGGKWVLVSGTTGYDYATGRINPDPVVQVHQCFANISAALSQADMSLDNLVRLRVLVTSRDIFDAVIDVIGEYCRNAFPANTAAICQLVSPEMLVEIEATAFSPVSEAEQSG